MRLPFGDPVLNLSSRWLLEGRDIETVLRWTSIGGIEEHGGSSMELRELWALG
jgi:hypothetical protein